MELATSKQFENTVDVALQASISSTNATTYTRHLVQSIDQLLGVRLMCGTQ
jgi:hypothetical protein